MTPFSCRVSVLLHHSDRWVTEDRAASSINGVHYAFEIYAFYHSNLYFKPSVKQCIRFPQVFLLRPLKAAMSR
jgi:hypothetical protein